MVVVGGGGGGDGGGFIRLRFVSRKENTLHMLLAVLLGSSVKQ